MQIVTIAFVALSVLWILGWQIAVIARRRNLKISHGFGEDKQLRNRIRVHANAIENLVPFGLLVLTLAVMGGSNMFVVAMIALMAVGRVVHPFGMLDPKRFHIMRVIGMGCSMTATALLGLYTLFVAIV